MPTKSEQDRWLKIARGMLECPTAPLYEDLPAAHVRAFAAARKDLFFKVDAVGNVLLGYPARDAKKADPLVMVAHLDHPGFWVERVQGRRTKLKFMGGVQEGYPVKGSRLRFYKRGEAKAIGRGRLLKAEFGDGAFGRRRLLAGTAEIISGRADPGGYTMWDFPGFSLRNGKVVTRCCDDLMGAAAALCVLDELCRRKPKNGAAWALFTRAEEIGFLGTLWAIDKKWLPKSSRVISLECSRALPTAPQGQGVIVRVGDSASLFDPPFTEALRQACEAVKKKDKRFRYQRRLMDGGACEATAFVNAGYRSSGLALPLGNYHNQKGLDRGKKGMGAESVEVSDFTGEVQLLYEMAQMGKGLENLEGFVGRRMAERTQQARKDLTRISLLA